jgi:glutathione S-transferase
MSAPVLLTIPISHYGERARWALDRSTVAYDERHHIQGFSWVAALRAGRRKMLPVLVTESEVVTDSERIVRWADEHGAALFPRNTAEAEEVVTLSRRFADVFGVETRRVAYDSLFAAGDRLLSYNEGRAPTLQAATVRRAFWLARMFAVEYLGVRPDDVERAVGTVDRILDEVGERLRDGRRYLVGDAFSAADLTFAAMAAPCVLPDRYGVTLPTLDELQSPARARVASWRAHPSGQFALRLYEERPAPRGRFAHPLRVAPRPVDFRP